MTIEIHSFGIAITALGSVTRVRILGVIGVIGVTVPTDSPTLRAVLRGSGRGDRCHVELIPRRPRGAQERAEVFTSPNVEFARARRTKCR